MFMVILHVNLTCYANKHNYNMLHLHYIHACYNFVNMVTFVGLKYLYQDL